MAFYSYDFLTVSGIKGSYPTCSKIRIRGTGLDGGSTNLDKTYDVSGNKPNGTYGKGSGLAAMGDRDESVVFDIILYDANDNVIATHSTTATYARTSTYPGS